MSKPNSPRKRVLKCSYCETRPMEAEYRPFCSKRCANLDLGKWLGDGYAIPGAPSDQAEQGVPAKPSDEG